MTVAPISTRLPVEAATRLRAMAADQGSTVSVLVRELVLAQLEMVTPKRAQLALDLDAAGERSSAA
jgi:predicted DNA-binding protein